MNKNQRLITLHTHKLGVLLYDARLATRRSVEECAEAIGVTPEMFKTFEAGEAAPSLPQLENLAYFLDLPVEHFWEGEALSESKATGAVQDANRLNQIRNHIIGTRLKLSRTERNLSLKELAEITSIPVERLTAFEGSQASVSLPELEVIAAALDIRVETFLDDHGTIGAWRAQQATIQKFMELPERHQQFILLPVNRPYLELAMRLSELSVEKLRGIAEGLLEITY